MPVNAQEDEIGHGSLTYIQHISTVCISTSYFCIHCVQRPVHMWKVHLTHMLWIGGFVCSRSLDSNGENDCHSMNSCTNDSLPHRGTT